MTHNVGFPLVVQIKLLCFFMLLIVLKKHGIDHISSQKVLIIFGPHKNIVKTILFLTNKYYQKEKILFTVFFLY